MAELFLHHNVAEVFVSIIDCLHGNNTKTKANGEKSFFKICKQDPETALFYIIGLIRV